MLNIRILEILVCPVSKTPLKYDKQANELVCQSSGLVYPVRDGIPVLLKTLEPKMQPTNRPI